MTAGLHDQDEAVVAIVDADRCDDDCSSEIVERFYDLPELPFTCPVERAYFADENNLSTCFVWEDVELCDGSCECIDPDEIPDRPRQHPQLTADSVLLVESCEAEDERQRRGG